MSAFIINRDGYVCWAETLSRVTDEEVSRMTQSQKEAYGRAATLALPQHVEDRYHVSG